MDRVLSEIIVYGKQESVNKYLPQHIDGCIRETAEELQCNIAKQYNRKAAVGNVDAEEAKTATKRYNVTLLPTLLFFQREKLAKRRVDSQPERAIREHWEVLNTS